MMPIKGNLAENKKGIKYVIKSSAGTIAGLNKRQSRTLKFIPQLLGGRHN